MGTRGAMGVRIDGVDKITYNHCDSYPSGLGESIVADVKQLLKDYGLRGVRKMARDLRLVSEKDIPTSDDVRRLKPVTDLGVSSQSETDWYCLTRNLQGDLAAALQFGVLIDGADFMTDSLFCEYAYIVNLDDKTFEVYQGFQHDKHSKGRYADLPTPENRTDYWPVALVATYPLKKIPKKWADEAFPPEEDE